MHHQRTQGKQSLLYSSTSTETAFFWGTANIFYYREEISAFEDGGSKIYFRYGPAPPPFLPYLQSHFMSKSRQTTTRKRRNPMQASPNGTRPSPAMLRFVALSLDKCWICVYLGISETQTFFFQWPIKPRDGAEINGAAVLPGRGVKWYSITVLWAICPRKNRNWDVWYLAISSANFDTNAFDLHSHCPKSSWSREGFLPERIFGREYFVQTISVRHGCKLGAQAWHHNYTWEHWVNLWLKKIFSLISGCYCTDHRRKYVPPLVLSRGSTMHAPHGSIILSRIYRFAVSAKPYVK